MRDVLCTIEDHACIVNIEAALADTLHPKFGNVNFRKTIWKEIKITQKGVLRKMSLFLQVS